MLKSLSVFFPCFNDGKILPYLIHRTYGVLPKIAKDYEVLVVNDGSTDSSGDVLEKLTHEYKNLRIIHHKKNFGYGAALITGFSNAKKEWVFYTDGDGQYEPEELLLLIKKIKPHIYVVNGYKLTRNDPLLRQLIGDLYNFFLHVIFPLPIRDVDCDFRLIRRSVLQKINLEFTSGAVCLELIVKLQEAGARFAQVGVHHYKRIYGESEFFTFEHIVKTLRDDIRLYLSLFHKKCWP